MEDAITILSDAPMNISNPPWRYVLWNPTLRKINTKVSPLLSESIFLCYAKEPPKNKQYNLLAEYRKAVDDPSAVFPCPYINEISFEGDYTIEKIRSSLKDHVLILFDEIRSSVMQLNTDIQEIPHKYFAEYRLQDTFVSVTPRVRDIRLILNIPDKGIHDPKNLARVLHYRSGRGKGSLEVKISSSEQLQDVLDLIVQAYKVNQWHS